MNRRILTLIVALVPIVVFGVLLAGVTVPYVSLGPGPTFDTLGEVDGKQVVDIKGTQTHPTTGHLDMTTVSQRDDLSLAEALTLWLSGQEQLMPRDLVYPPGQSRDEIDKANDADFKESEHNAEFAALGYLKYPRAVTVVVVSDPGPSVGKLQTGDSIQAVNGTPVTNGGPVHVVAEAHQTRPADRGGLPPQKRTPRGRPDHAGQTPRSRLWLCGCLGD